MAAYGTPDVAIAGLLVNSDFVIESAIAQGAIEYGAPVYGDVGVENVCYPASAVSGLTAPRFLGVAVFVQNGNKTVGAGTAKYSQYDSVNILTNGQVWVRAAATVADKDPAYVVAGTDTFTDVATDNDDIGGYFRSNVHSNLAVLEVRGLK